METETRTFQGAVERFKVWSKIRFEESEARLLIEDCFTVLRAPGDFPEVVQSWKAFIDTVQPQIKERMESADWSKTDGQVLVLISIASIEIRKGILNFLPSQVSTILRDDDKEALWAWHLLNHGMMLQPQDPHCLLRPSALFFMGGPYAAREIERRAGKHPLGFVAGMLGYLWKSDDGKLLPEDVAVAGLKMIGGSARKKIPATMRPKRDEGKTARGVLDNKLGPLEEQVTETLLKDFFKDTGEEILARSLDGLLNVVPLAVARDVIDRGKTKQAEIERGIKFESDSEEIKFKIKEYPMETKSDNNVLEFTERYIQRLSEFYLKYPEHRELLDARYGNLSQRELAKKHGITDRAIRKRTDKAEEDLKKWLRISTKHHSPKSPKNS